VIRRPWRGLSEYLNLLLASADTLFVLNQWRQACLLARPGEDLDWAEPESEDLVEAISGAIHTGRPEIFEEPGASAAFRALSPIDRAARAWTHKQSSFAVITARLNVLRVVATDGVTNEDQIRQLADVCELVAITVNEEFALRLQDAALRDPLTGIGNRRAMDLAWQTALAQGRRLGHPTCVIAIDLDGLKGINDLRGHAAGDAAIVGLAAALRAALRDTDQIFRIGGDEFVAILPRTEAAGAGDLLARMAQFQAPRFSWGAADTIQDGSTLEAILDIADKRLYAQRRRTRPAGSTRFSSTVVHPPARRPLPLVPDSRKRAIELVVTGALALTIGMIVSTISGGDHTLCATGMGSSIVNCGLSNSVYYGGIILAVAGGLILGFGTMAAALLRGGQQPDGPSHDEDSMPGRQPDLGTQWSGDLRSGRRHSSNSPPPGARRPADPAP
jgi:diguanylate cyclase (GGDEF)-like protein